MTAQEANELACKVGYEKWAKELEAVYEFINKMASSGLFEAKVEMSYEAGNCISQVLKEEGYRVAQDEEGLSISW